RVQQRQTPGLDNGETATDVCRPVAWPAAFKMRPQIEMRVKLLTAAGQPRHRQHMGIKQRAEECAEEHDLGKYEPGHGDAKRSFFPLTIDAGQAFIDDVT